MKFKELLGIILTGVGILLYVVPIAYGFFNRPLTIDSIWGKGFYVSMILVLIGPALWLGEVPEAIVGAVRAKIVGFKGGSQ